MIRRFTLNTLILRAYCSLLEILETVLASAEGNLEQHKDFEWNRIQRDGYKCDVVTVYNQDITTIKAAFVTLFQDLRRFIVEAGYVLRKLDVPDAINIIYAHCKELQPGEKVLLEGDTVYEEAESDELVSNETTVSQLVSKGFNHLYCQLTITTDADEAMQWLLKYMDNPGTYDLALQCRSLIGDPHSLLRGMTCVFI